MHPKLRDLFDMKLERVLSGLPERLTKLIEEVPLHVEDYPSQELMAELGITDRSALCGVYSGISLADRSVNHNYRPPDYVTIYREGIFRISENNKGELTEKELLRQIKITVLHELAHYHGLNETEIADLGYG